MMKKTQICRNCKLLVQLPAKQTAHRCQGKLENEASAIAAAKTHIFTSLGFEHKGFKQQQKSSAGKIVNSRKNAREVAT